MKQKTVKKINDKIEAVERIMTEENMKKKDFPIFLFFSGCVFSPSALSIISEMIVWQQQQQWKDLNKNKKLDWWWIRSSSSSTTTMKKNWIQKIYFETIG